MFRQKSTLYVVLVCHAVPLRGRYCPGDLRNAKSRIAGFKGDFCGICGICGENLFAVFAGELFARPKQRRIFL